MTSFLQKITASFLTKESLLKEFSKILKDPEFKDYLWDFHTEVGHGDSDFFEPTDEEAEEIYDNLPLKFKKFKAVFKPIFLNGKLVVWRALDTDKINYNRVGESWTWEEDAAQSYWGKEDKHVVLKALVDKTAIDMYGTLACALYDIEGGGVAAEREIRLKQGAKIEILEPEKKSATASFLKKIKTKYTITAGETLTLWHGGNLDIDKETVSHKKKRWEFGPGLYLTTNYTVAQMFRQQVYSKYIRQYHVTSKKKADSILKIGFFAKRSACTDEFINLINDDVLDEMLEAKGVDVETTEEDLLDLWCSYYGKGTILFTSLEPIMDYGDTILEFTPNHNITWLGSGIHGTLWYSPKVIPAKCFTLKNKIEAEGR